MSESPSTPGPAAVLSAKEILGALEAHEFVLHFQPIVALDDTQPQGVEALIRWQHPQDGLLGPDLFLPAVAQTPVMAAITRWVLTEACQAPARWPGWTVSVNVTPRDLAGEALVTDVLGALDAAHIPPERLILELTETALVQDMNRAAKVLTELHGHGIGIALDDFGTGYSSMLYLRELPVTSVKIDRVFVDGLVREADDRAIVTSLLTLARTVGITAVAEGVETEKQARQLHALGCPLGQGYLWSRPVAADSLDEVYREGLPTSGRRARKRTTTAVDTVLLSRANELLERGASLNTIAAALNAAGERTESGARWSTASVARLINSKNAWPPR